MEKNKVWNYLARIKEDHVPYRCCQMKVSYHRSNTSVHNHLRANNHQKGHPEFSNQWLVCSAHEVSQVLNVQGCGR